MKYAIVIEKTSTGYSAYSPDVPGCVAADSSRDQVVEAFADALAFHLEGLKLEGLAVPQPAAEVDYVRVAA